MLYIWIYLICLFIVTGHCGHRLVIKHKRGEKIQSATIASLIVMALAPISLLVIIGAYLSAGLLMFNDKILKQS